MAVESADNHENDGVNVVDGQDSRHVATAKLPEPNPETDEEEEDDDDDDDEEEEDEPKLKYSRLTANLGSVYRGGDATSSLLVAGDKMILGTHNGKLHILSIPSFQSLRVYPAHSASITSVSVSPFPPPLPTGKLDASIKFAPDPPGTPNRSATGNAGSTPSPRAPKQPPIAITPSNSIYIATSSIDGHVFITSLVDPKDVMKRNFARPVQAVALSPEFKSDRSYISGGLAGNVILTVGGRAGVSANANTNSAAAAASGWLGSIGLGTNTGKDTVLHSGEGAISTIKWSLTGKFVAWVNEQGINIMRSTIDLESIDSDSAWKRIAQVDRPNRRGWEDMAGVWKARAEWVNENNLESDDEDTHINGNIHHTSDASKALQAVGKNGTKTKKKRFEKLLVGWGDTAWVLKVHPGGSGIGKHIGERSVGSADIVHILRFDDCIISGLSLYTPSLILILAYRTRDDNDKPIPSSVQTTPRRGVHHRQNGLQPELRLIDMATKDEVDVDTLTVSRFESLSAADYQLNTLYVPRSPIPGPVPKGAFEALGTGLWDAGVSAGRIFSSGASIISMANSGDTEKGSPSVGSASASKASAPASRSQEMLTTAASVGLKIFIQSPYDCVLAVKRDLSDHLTWLLERHRYKDAWELIDEHPDVAAALPVDETPVTPSKNNQSLKEFFADDSASQTTITTSRAFNSATEKEKRRIGDLWVQQLVTAGDWESAGKVAGRVLGTSSRWEHWVWAFAEAGRFDEITPYIPSKQLHPPLPSLVYELALGHYIINDRVRFKQLIDQWDPELFDINAVVSAIEGKLKAGDVSEDTIEDDERGRDWRILLESLAKLHLADGKPKEALRCHIKLQNADAALGLIRDYHLLDAVADDIPGFILLRVSRDQLETAPLNELEEASAEAVHLLVDDAYQGIVKPEIVVKQLQQKDQKLQPFLLFYFRALWKGEGTGTELRTDNQRLAAEGRSFVEEFGDLAVAVFAQYDRPLLMEFLKASTSYSFDKACQICEAKDFIPELVYLLSKTGQMKRALFLIIDKLSDVSRAIEFAKEQDDPDLWNDLLDYSMDKPRFIRGLLHEVGTAINPLDLVRRIPEGLEIEGLRDGILRMVREYEIQHSISEGVARVLRGEVAQGMSELRAGQNKGLRFEVIHEEPKHTDLFVEQPTVPGEGQVIIQEDEIQPVVEAEIDVKPGHCVVCGKAFDENEKETLLGFACGHVYHLSCLLSRVSDDRTTAEAERLQARLAVDADDGYSGRSVGAKVAHAHIIRNAVRGGCVICKERAAEE